MRKNKDLFSIFPADAGVNLEKNGLQYLRDDIPRGCGGEPSLESKKMDSNIYSPRMRG